MEGLYLRGENHFNISMAKRKKKIMEKIQIDEKKVCESVDDVRPECFGGKKDYCNPDICGQYYERCRNIPQFQESYGFIHGEGSIVKIKVP